MFKGKVFLTSSRIGILKFVSSKVDFLQEFNEIIISSFKIRNFLIQFEAVILDSEVISGGMLTTSLFHRNLNLHDFWRLCYDCRD